MIGAVLAYMFLPLVNRFEQRVPRWAAILLVYALVFALVFTFFAFIVPHSPSSSASCSGPYRT